VPIYAIEELPIAREESIQLGIQRDREKLHGGKATLRLGDVGCQDASQGLDSRRENARSKQTIVSKTI
jgi:hypothetical protein